MVRSWFFFSTNLARAYFWLGEMDYLFLQVALVNKCMVLLRAVEFAGAERAH